MELQTVLSERDNIDDVVAIYLLGSILNRTSNGQVVLTSEVGVPPSHALSILFACLHGLFFFRRQLMLPALSLRGVRGWR